MLLPTRLAAVLIAASLVAGCSYSVFDRDTTASFNGSAQPAWTKQAEPEPEIEPPQTIDADTVVRSNEVPSRPNVARSSSLYARAVEARPIEAAKPPVEVAKPVTVPPPPAPQATERVSIEPRGHAYLFRGVAGLIYSRGMDRLAEEIRRTGIKADVDTYLMWRPMAEAAIRSYRRDPVPITIIGHSAGGDSAVAFAEVLNREKIPVSLLVTYDPTRIADDVPPNVERYINLYQSRNIMGGGDVTSGRGFHGHYASVNLRDHYEIVHINIEKAEYLHKQLVTKIAELVATPASAQGDAIPIRYVVPPRASIELWDSGMPVIVAAGDTMQSLSATYHVPVWAIAQVNHLSERSEVKPGQRMVIPRHLVPMAAPNDIPVSSLTPPSR
jgi:hypothetical protein